MYFCSDTYIHTYIHTCIHTFIHADIHTYIFAFIHTYIHTFIHIYIHKYMDVSVVKWLAWLTSNCRQIGAIGLKPNLCQCVYVCVCIVNPDIQTIHRCSHTSIHTYIHTSTYIYIHLHTYIHTYKVQLITMEKPEMS